MKHNENSRVKIPALVHLTRLGYEYLSLKNYHGIIHPDTNIFVDIFRESISCMTSREIAPVRRSIYSSVCESSGDSFCQGRLSLISFRIS